MIFFGSFQDLEQKKGKLSSLRQLVDEIKAFEEEASEFKRSIERINIYQKLKCRCLSLA